ncbi:hypothetical protein EUGRSUZ_H04060 [Eucalyptus grandis]|uniref:Uncharacterized protein n=2 Tax=Eucalyptus grandis TaxID=71139 RepID=A0ACC3JV01_EUCGR|nr:hypothetical protein EUGRSUZ_H04060 [Eucalyptus grandis]
MHVYSQYHIEDRNNLRQKIGFTKWKSLSRATGRHVAAQPESLARQRLGRRAGARAGADGGAAGEEPRELAHGPDLHLQSLDVVGGFLEYHRQRLLPAAGDQPAEEPHLPLHGRYPLPPQPRHTHPRLPRPPGRRRRRRHRSRGPLPLPELANPDPARQDGPAPPRPPLGRRRQGPVGRLADGPPAAAAAASHSSAAAAPGLGQGAEEVGGEDLLLGLGLPLGGQTPGLGLGLGLSLSLLLPPPRLSLPRPVGTGGGWVARPDRIRRDQGRRHRTRWVDPIPGSSIQTRKRVSESQNFAAF